MIELPYKMTKIASSSGLVIMRQISNQYNMKTSNFNPKLISFMHRRTLNISLTVEYWSLDQNVSVSLLCCFSLCYQVLFVCKAFSFLYQEVDTGFSGRRIWKWAIHLSWMILVEIFLTTVWTQPSGGSPLATLTCFKETGNLTQQRHKNPLVRQPIGLFWQKSHKWSRISPLNHPKAFIVINITTADRWCERHWWSRHRGTREIRPWNEQFLLNAGVLETGQLGKSWVRAFQVCSGISVGLIEGCVSTPRMTVWCKWDCQGAVLTPIQCRKFILPGILLSSLFQTGLSAG